MKNDDNGEIVARCKCGAIPRVRVDIDYYEVVCPKCGRTTGWMSPRAEAVGYWKSMVQKANCR